MVSVGVLSKDILEEDDRADEASIVLKLNHGISLSGSDNSDSPVNLIFRNTADAQSIQSYSEEPIELQNKKPDHYISLKQSQKVDTRKDIVQNKEIEIDGEVMAVTIMDDNGSLVSREIYIEVSSVHDEGHEPRDRIAPALKENAKDDCIPMELDIPIFSSSNVSPKFDDA